MLPRVTISKLNDYLLPCLDRTSSLTLVGWSYSELLKT